MEGHEVGLILNGKQEDLSNNYLSALGQLKSIERRLISDEQLLDKYNALVQSYLKKRYVSILLSAELKWSFQVVWNVPHQTVLIPIKPHKGLQRC